MKVALVHDWLTGTRGGEAVLDAIVELFPDAELFTLLHVKGSVSPRIESLPIHTSWLQRVPGAERRYRHFLPLMPGMIESFDLSAFDLVVSSSHCVAKGVRKRPDAVHLSYVHAPMRYIWDRFDDYFGPGRASSAVRLAARLVRPRLQRWDRATAASDRVDAIVANSRFIAERIHDAWGREASVIHPFADLSRFTLPRRAGDFYLMLGAFAPYKRLDLAIEAFNRMKLPLRIVGGGQDEERLRALAGPTVEFLGALSDTAAADLYSRCRAFVFPGVEDFGITPIEAMASGAPVIAFGEGGAAETVSAEAGLLFRPQTVEALMEAVGRVESGAVRFDPEACRARAATFTRQAFQRKIATAIRDAWRARGKDPSVLRLEQWT